jgi:hydrogenase small subunit
MVSSTVSRGTGTFISYLRNFTQKSRNQTARWKETGHVPSGWANVDARGTVVDRTVGFFYERLKRAGTEFAPGSSRQRALQASASSYLNSAPASPQSAPLKEAAE